MYSAGISLSGVGNHARHNLIHNAPHQAISFSGNDHLMEFNEIHSVCHESNDAGAIYAGRDWTMRGTVIRHNYLHDIQGFEGRGCVGIYLDDKSDEMPLALYRSKGKTTGDEGSATIKHMFCGEQVDHELPGYHSRRAIIVLAFNEQGGDPMLLVLNGRLLAGRFFTGELLKKRYEPYSETDKALGVGNPMTTPMDEDYLPSSLKSALRKTLPFGMVKIEGAYQK